MTPSDIAKSYDRLADHWNNDAFPRTNGVVQHERARAFFQGLPSESVCIFTAGGLDAPFEKIDETWVLKCITAPLVLRLHSS